MSQFHLRDFLLSCQWSDIPLIAAVGDIHGQLTSLQKVIEILEKVKVSPVFVGDYIDRGPHSYGCIDLLAKAQKSHSNWVFIEGNHEASLLFSLEKDFCYMCPQGEHCAWREYWERGLPEQHKIFLNSLKTFYEPTGGQFIFVHGGIDDKYAWTPMNLIPKMSLQNTRYVSRHYTGKKTIVRGHELTNAPMEIIGKDIMLDTNWFGYISVAFLDNSKEATGQRLLGYMTISFDGSIHFTSLRQE